MGKSKSTGHSHSSGKVRAGDPGSSSRAPSTESIIFLFAVTPLWPVEGYTTWESNAVDRVGNIWPPSLARHYSPVLPEPGAEPVVYRFRDGTVRPAEGYSWWRSGDGSDRGAIYSPQRFDDQGNPIQSHKMACYSEHSVFNCWRQLPCVWSDADASVVNIDGGGAHRWVPLRFGYEYRQTNSGTTRATTRICEGGERVVAGSNASWIPGLIPSTLKARPESLPSGGLGGPLGVIIGLMALASSNPTRAFNSREWRDYEWRGTRDPNADIDPNDLPRGVLVHICYESVENDNTYINLMESWLDDFAHRRIAVKG